MNQNLLLELRKLQNEMAHGPRHTDPEHLRKRLQELKIAVPPEDLQWFVADLMRGFSNIGEHFVPTILLSVIRSLLQGCSADLACDPWAGFGVLAVTVHETIHARKTIACARNLESVALGQALTPQLVWSSGDPFQFLETLSIPPDVIASVLPFGLRTPAPVELHGEKGESVRCEGDLGQILLAAACLRLSPQGLGLFVVSSSFFFAPQSILHDLPRLGLGLEAALALPPGSFAPFANIDTYLVLARKRPATQLFVAQLSPDGQTNNQIVANFREKRADGPLDLGRLVAPHDFRGLDSLRLTEQLRDAEQRLGTPAVPLGDLAREIRLGRPGAEFAFPNADNALYIPLIGISDVVDSTDQMTLKRQNYAQVVIDASRSDAGFVARFLNSELGRAIREASKSGVIPKLNTTALRTLRVFIPSLETQMKILAVDGSLTASHNIVLGLQNDLASLRRALWSNPKELTAVGTRVRAFSERLAASAAPQVAATLDQWFETLPFPLASILRTWQATQSQDFKTKYEHLLHFFEATAEFLSVIFLSAFASQPGIFAVHREKLSEAWKNQHLSLERPSFGTWKVVVEYFSKQTRELLSADAEKRALCAGLFADPTQALAEMLGSKELVAVLSAANKMRNDWTGHGGVVSQDEAKLRNERLLVELQKLREIMKDTWREIQLLRALQCRPRRGIFENEVAVLAGSNSEFLTESRVMSAWLDIERLYLASANTGRPLLLLPFMQVGPSPASAKNACYFFNRIERDGARFVSYHFLDQPELKNSFEETREAIRFLTEIGTADVH